MSVQNIIKEFRNILTKYKPREFLNQNDFITTMELLSNHPKWEKKKAEGILRIQVIDDQWKHKAFLLHRIDGSVTDISFVIAARGKSDNILKRIKNACRVAIRPTISRFKSRINFGIDKCPITNEILNLGDTHIDHYDFAFDKVVKLWLEEFESIEYVSSFLNNETEDMVIEDRFTNPDLVNDFVKFHDQHTNLRAVSKKANLSILRKKGDLVNEEVTSS